jgi:hypothetical protein
MTTCEGWALTKSVFGRSRACRLRRPVARHKVEVKMKDILSRAAPAVLTQVYADRAELGTDDGGKKLSHSHHSSRFLGSNRPDVAPMPTWDDEDVTPGGGRLA